mgnify:CR=1 FL=1
MLRLSLWSVVTNLSQEESFYLSKERGHVSLGHDPPQHHPARALSQCAERGCR